VKGGATERVSILRKGWSRISRGVTARDVLAQKQGLNKVKKIDLPPVDDPEGFSVGWEEKKRENSPESVAKNSGMGGRYAVKYGSKGRQHISKNKMLGWHAREKGKVPSGRARDLKSLRKKKRRGQEKSYGGGRLGQQWWYLKERRKKQKREGVGKGKRLANPAPIVDRRPQIGTGPHHQGGPAEIKEGGKGDLRRRNVLRTPKSSRGDIKGGETFKWGLQPDPTKKGEDYPGIMLTRTLTETSGCDQRTTSTAKKVKTKRREPDHVKQPDIAGDHCQKKEGKKILGKKRRSRPFKNSNGRPNGRREVVRQIKRFKGADLGGGRKSTGG